MGTGYGTGQADAGEASELSDGTAHDSGLAGSAGSKKQERGGGFMNRQQRRAMEKRRIARKAVDAAMKEHDEKFGQVEVELYFTAFGLALEELHGFKQERITKVWKKADQYIESIINGDETKETLQQKLLDRANVMCSFR